MMVSFDRTIWRAAKAIQGSWLSRETTGRPSNCPHTSGASSTSSAAATNGP